MQRAVAAAAEDGGRAGLLGDLRDLLGLRRAARLHDVRLESPGPAGLHEHIGEQRRGQGASRARVDHEHQRARRNRRVGRVERRMSRMRRHGQIIRAV